MFSDLDPVNTQAPVEEEYVSEDITAIAYSPDGSCLATGDRSGKLTLLQTDFSRKATSEVNWIPYFQYQSHLPEFDFLKSVEIEAKINQIKFLHPMGNSQHILSCNDKTIKLWKVGKLSPIYECKSAETFKRTGRFVLPRRTRKFSDMSLKDFGESPKNQKDLSERISNRQPPDASGLIEDGDMLAASNKRVFGDAHAYHINSVEVHKDGESFFSADDLRINWWNLNRPSTCFTFVDIKPEDMNDLNEVITAVHLHPSQSSLLAYSSSRGVVKVCDTRIGAICSSYSNTYVDSNSGAQKSSKSFINDIINSISDFKFSSDGRHMVTRDYMNIKLWDLSMESKPIKTIPVHAHLRSQLYDLYSSDTIFDKFEVCCSSDGMNFASGSYSNQIKIYRSEGPHKGLITVDLPAELQSANPSPADPVPAMSIPNNCHIDSTDYSQAPDTPGRGGKIRKKFGLNGRDSGTGAAAAAEATGGHDAVGAHVRTEEKVLHCAWHPHESTLAVVSKTGLCLYNV